MTKMKIAIGNDHAGTALKNKVMQVLGEKYTFTNHGTDAEESVDYPDYVHPVASDVEEGRDAAKIIVLNGFVQTHID